MIKEADRQKFADLTSKTAEEQAQFFLRVFVMEFMGTFEEVLNLCAEFRKFGSADGQKEISELDEFETHRFLEKRGETLTVKALRENILKELDIDQNHRVSFIEYLLWKNKKTVHELFAPPKGGPTPQMLEDLEKAMKEYQAALDIKRAREKKIYDLKEIAAKGGVKGMTAKNEIEQIEKEDLLALNKQEITSAAKKRIVQKQIDNCDGTAEREKALKAEQERLRQLEEQKKAEEERKKLESRNKLKQKASLWENK